MLTRDTALATLKTMLNDAGQAPETLDLERTWQVFDSFCQRAIDCESDGVIVQWGNDYDTSKGWRNRVRVGFYYSVLRQFDDGDEEFEQLEIIWHYPLDDNLSQMVAGNSDWCFKEGDCDFSAFLQVQREKPLYQLLKQRTPTHSEVYQVNTG